MSTSSFSLVSLSYSMTEFGETHEVKTSIIHYNLSINYISKT